MTDRKYSSGGAPPPSRHQSPAQSNAQCHLDSLDGVLGTQPESAFHPRPRPFRTNSSTSSPPPSASPSCVEPNSGSDKRAKAPRTTLEPAIRRDSGYTDAATVSRPEREDFHKTNGTTAVLPKLKQIREGKAKTVPRSRGSSTIGSVLVSKLRRRRHIEDSALNRSRERRQHGSSQRHPDSLANLSNPSEISIDSGITQQSNTSGGSSLTVTRTSHDSGSRKTDRERPYQGRRSPTPGALNPQTLANMDAPHADVFQFLRPDSKANSIASDDTHHMTPTTTVSSTSSSSADTHLNDERSSVAVAFPHELESPASSPISMRKSDNDDFHYQGHDYRKPGAPLYASSFVHDQVDEDEDDSNTSDEDEDEDEYQDEDQNEDQDENESGDDASGAESDAKYDDDAHTGPADLGHAPNLALNKVPPPIAPSKPSRPSDPHTRRLRRQERNFANHVLQSPQPQKDFQFSVDPSAQHQPRPLYSPRVYSGASPAASHATSGPSPAWPPVPPMPAPLAVGYSPHQSPERNHAFPLTVRPPGQAMQQMPPPFPPYLCQPPVYQPHAPGPDLSKTTVMGYELLADKLSKPTRAGSKRAAKGGKRRVVPMYRKFEHLNHRVLLHLQDEVSELEEELRHVDEVIAQTLPRDESGRAYPGSRRGDARFGGEPHYRRTELLGRIFQKLGQYNQALCSFTTLLKELDPTTSEDVQAYRTWMDKRTPIDYAERQFLAREQDLVVVSRKPYATTNHGGGQHHSAAGWFPLTLSLPLMAFAIVPSVLGRLVVIALICGAEVWMVTVTPEFVDLMSTREWTVAAVL